MAYNFSYGGLSPDVNIQYDSSASSGGYGDMFKSIMGGGKDPFKNLLGGGGGGDFQYGGGGMLGAAGGRVGGSAAPAGFTGRGGGTRPVTAYAREQFFGDEKIRQAQAIASAQNAGAMGVAQLNARAQLAAQMMNLEAERQARLQAQIDNEKNRQLQLEMQRRNFGADDYQTRQQFHYQYGI